MSDEIFDQKLKEAFPYLCKDMHGDMRVTCMAWGCEVGKGWQNIIWEMCEKLSCIIPDDRKDEFFFDQIKEKFGSLRVYMSIENEDITRTIKDAEQKSRITCEVCGSPGELRRGPWIKVRCDSCLDKTKNG